MTQVVGVDGWKGGWIAVALLDGRFQRALAVETFRAVLDAFPRAEAIAVDIPIGLPPPYPRRADVEARRLLSGSASRVFPTYPRPVYEAQTQADANRRAFALAGLGIGSTAWRLGPKILEVASLADQRVREVHPEVSFRQLARHPLVSKKTWAGQRARQDALTSAAIVLPDDLGDAGRVPPDDVLDAAAAAWSAWRITRGQAQTLPADPLPGEPRLRY